MHWAARCQEICFCAIFFLCSIFFVVIVPDNFMPFFNIQMFSFTPYSFCLIFYVFMQNICFVFLFVISIHLMYYTSILLVLTVLYSIQKKTSALGACSVPAVVWAFNGTAGTATGTGDSSWL